VRDLKVEGQKSFDMFPSHKIVFFEKKVVFEKFNKFFKQQYN
jgi:hypothetical protein